MRPVPGTITDPAATRALFPAPPPTHLTLDRAEVGVVLSLILFVEGWEGLYEEEEALKRRIEEFLGASEPASRSQ